MLFNYRKYMFVLFVLNDIFDYCFEIEGRLFLETAYWPFSL